MTSINVNLGQCVPNCWEIPGEHLSTCPGKPVHVPLSLEPWRSVTVKVRMGECRCNARSPVSIERLAGEHNGHCPARPVEVVCSISGKTWPESEVADVDNPHDPNGRWGAGAGDVFRGTISACNARWTLIKALVTGEDWDGMRATLPLFRQRDAAYAAITKVARMERAIFEAQGEYTSAMDGHHHPDWHRDPESYVMPSQKMLALCVQRLIEQVGVMS